MRSLMTLVLVSFFALLHASVEPQAFVPPGIDSFDGKHWASMAIGESTDKEIRGQYKTSKGAFRPDALLLSDGKATGVRVDAMLHGRGNDAKLTGFRIAYVGTHPDLAGIETKIGSAKAYYSRVRLEDWYLKVWADRGIVAVVRSGQCDLVLLTSPSLIPNLVQGYSSSEVEVTTQVDPHAGEPKVVSVGTVNVNYDSPAIGFDQTHDRKDWEDWGKSFNPQGLVSFGSGDGSIDVDVRTEYDAKRGGTVTVKVSLSGSTPYGTLRADGTGFGSLPKVQNATDEANFKLAAEIAYTKASLDAKQGLERSVVDNMSTQGPPSPTKVREAAVAALIDAAGAFAFTGSTFQFGSVEVTIKDNFFRSAAMVDGLKAGCEKRIKQMTAGGSLMYKEGSPGKVTMFMHFDSNAGDARAWGNVKIEGSTEGGSITVDNRAETPTFDTLSDIGSPRQAFGSFPRDLIEKAEQMFADKAANGKLGPPLTASNAKKPEKTDDTGPFTYGKITVDISGDYLDAAGVDFYTKKINDRFADFPNKGTRAFRSELAYQEGTPGSVTYKVKIDRKKGGMKMHFEGTIEAIRNGKTIKVRQSFDTDGSEDKAPIEVKSFMEMSAYFLEKEFDRKLSSKR